MLSERFAKYQFHVERVTCKSIINTYHGAKREVYRRAYHELVTYGLRPRDCNVSMFVKDEKTPLYDVYDKPPRAIQYRSPKYNLVLATYLKPLEEEFYSLNGFGPSKTRVVTKGLNKKKLADLLMKKAGCFDQPVFIELDHSRFDSTISETMLKKEHKFYVDKFGDRYLASLLRHQIYNKGVSRNGITYKVKGTRMSGDYNTGLGNSLLNRAIIEYMVKDIKHELMVDGDDSVLIVEAKDLGFFNPEYFARLGLKTKIQYKTRIEQVDYCRCRLVISSKVMARDPARIFTNLGTSTRMYGPKGFMYWLNACLACEYYSNPGLPLVNSFKPFTKMKLLKDSDFYRKMEQFVYEEHPIDRVGYWQTWGISPDMQVLLEAQLTTILEKYIEVQHVPTTRSALLSLREEIAKLADDRRRAAPPDLDECRIRLGQERLE